MLSFSWIDIIHDATVLPPLFLWLFQIIFLDNYSIEFDETNSFPKYLFRGRDECVDTLTGDNLISELCNKILELSSKGEKNETTE